MTAAQLSPQGSDSLHQSAVWIDVGGQFRGSGFLVSPGVILTSAHVVVGADGPAAEVRVHHSSASQPVAAENIRAEPRTGSGGLFYPYPDLALLSAPQLEGQKVATLASAEAQPGMEVMALGYSTNTPTPGVQPDTLALRVAGPSGDFVKVLGDGVREGLSGSMLLGADDGLIYGVLKGSRSYRDDHGGWFVPLLAVTAFLGISAAATPSEAGTTAPPSDMELVEAMMAFPAMMRLDSRYDLLDKMGDHLGLPHSFEVDERPDRRDHLYRIVRRCRHYRDDRAALRALYTAMEELVPYDGGLDKLHMLIGRTIGGWEGE
ncbi:effector-associated domain 2-containing protein [Streptomyces anulatus]